MFLAPLVLLAPRVGAAAEGNMTLCLHTNTSSGAGYRGALEAWAKAGIKKVYTTSGGAQSVQHDV